MNKKKTGQLRYASYGRCSSDDQKHNDFSTVDVQHDLNKRKIAELGGVLAGLYADEARSGTNLNRPDWKRLLTDAQAHKFDVVVATYMSRLGRGDAFTIAEHELKKAGVQVVLVQESFGDDLAGYVNKRMTVMMDGMYPKMVSQWTRTKLKEMVKHGFRCGGKLPFGYKTEVVVDSDMVSTHDGKLPQRLIPNPDTAPFVREAFCVFAKTGSLSRTADFLQTVTSRRWTTDMALYLIRNEVYLGIYTFGEWRNDAAHEPIVPEPLWNAVQVRDQQRTRAPKRSPKDTSSFYLRSLVFCAHCNMRMTPANHHGRTAPVRYYECLGNTKHRQTCPVRRVNAFSLHAAVLQEIQRAAAHPTRMAELLREAVKKLPQSSALQEQISAVDRRIRDVDKRSNNCLEAVERGGAGVKTLLKRLDELEAEGVALTEQRQKIELQLAESRLNRPDVEQVRSLWLRFGELWEHASEEERMDLLPLIVERVELTEKEKGTVTLSLIGRERLTRDFSASENVVINPDKGPQSLPVARFTPGSPPAPGNSPAFTPSGTDIPLLLLPGGTIRKKIPRPWQEDVPMIDHGY